MFRNYFKTTWRNIWRQKTFSFINILGLAMGLAAVWLIALFVLNEMSYDRYHENAGRIYRLASHGRWNEEKFDITGTSGLAAEALKTDFPEIEDALRIDIEGGGIIKYGDKKLKELFISYSSDYNKYMLKSE